MATVTKGRTFVSGETVTPTKLNELVDLATVTSIVDADVSASAAIALSKLATGALPAAITVASANLVDGTIATADVADAAITPAKLSQPYTLATSVASTSGTSIDFTGIPSWANRITVMFNGVSTNGTNLLLIQIGAGSVTTSGYSSSSGNVFGTNQCQVTGSSAGFVINSGGGTLVRHGHMLITKINGNSWVSSHSTGEASQAGNCSGGGTVTLSGTLDRVRITTVNGTDAFDAGSINIAYEG